MKPAAVGKSRLHVGGIARAELARAIALDTIEAASRASSVSRVIVVTADAGLAAALADDPDAARDRAAATDGPDVRARAIGKGPAGGTNGSTVTHGSAAAGDAPAIVVVAEPEPSGLNAAIRAGLDACGPAAPRAVLLGDLPALRPSDLDAALTRALRVGRGLVPDAEGSGTTLLTARGGLSLVPHFGAGSAESHRAAGHEELGVAASSLRRDLDTAAHLEAAKTLGLGPRTTALLARR